MKYFIKKMAKAVKLDAFFTRQSDAAIILGLHSISAHDGSMLSQRISPIGPGLFGEILHYLQKLGFAFTSLDEIVNCPDRSKKVAITFDDGFKSVYANAFPILREFQAPFTVFLTTSTLGSDHLLWLHRIYAGVDRLSQENVYHIMERCSVKVSLGRSLKETLGVLVCSETPNKLSLFADELASAAHLTPSDETNIAADLYLKPEEVIVMTQNGMTIGAHGHNHWCLETLDQSLTEIEISSCKKNIMDAFGFDVTHYALPFGKSNPHILSVLERFGIKSLCTTERGLVQTDINPFGLPRLMIGSETGVVDVAGQITLLHLKHSLFTDQRNG